MLKSKLTLQWHRDNRQKSLCEVLLCNDATTALPVDVAKLPRAEMYCVSHRHQTETINQGDQLSRSLWRYFHTPHAIAASLYQVAQFYVVLLNIFNIFLLVANCHNKQEKKKENYSIAPVIDTQMRCFH